MKFITTDHPRRWTVLSYLATMLLVAGCSTTPIKGYPGPERQAEELAVVTNDVDYLATANPFAETGEARLMAIDGVAGPNGEYFGYHSTWDGKLNVAVLPGEHLCSVIFMGRRHNASMKSNAPEKFKFTAEKGHIYLLSYDKSEHWWNPVLIDITAKRRIYPPEKNNPSATNRGLTLRFP